MIFGERHSFAVECEFTSQNGTWIYGRFRVWVGGHPIGTYSEEVLTLLCTTGVLRKSIAVADSDVASLSPQEFLDLVWGAVYDGAEYNHDGHRIWSPYVWFDSCEGFEPVRSVIAKIADTFRIVWQHANEGFAREHYVGVREYGSVVCDFIVWLDCGIGDRRVGADRGLTEPSAAPNGGPATQLGNSGVTEGPPSVS